MHNSNITIQTQSHSYPIFFGGGQLQGLSTTLPDYINGNKAFIVTDEHVAPHYLPSVERALDAIGVEYHHFILPSGEATKSFTRLEALCEHMLELMPDRHTTLIALGGGVIGDLTGFAASILLRGIDFIQIPTTLLAQVDSSVGGKTAVNAKMGKNLIGSFYQPRAVFADSDTLRSLSIRNLLAGYAEVVKYGLLGDRGFYEYLLEHGSALFDGDEETIAYIIRHCCQMKADIVAEDEKEKGKRALLNLGHTFGHAIEKMANYDGSVLHGEAVAVGCLMAMTLSQTYGNVTQAEIDTLKEHFATIGMPRTLTELYSGIDWDAALLTQFCYHDKKASGGRTAFIVLDEIGAARVDRDVQDHHIQAIFSEYI